MSSLVLNPQTQSHGVLSLNTPAAFLQAEELYPGPAALRWSPHQAVPSESSFNSPLPVFTPQSLLR